MLRACLNQKKKLSKNKKKTVCEKHKSIKKNNAWPRAVRKGEGEAVKAKRSTQNEAKR